MEITTSPVQSGLFAVSVRVSATSSVCPCATLATFPGYNPTAGPGEPAEAPANPALTLGAGEAELEKQTNGWRTKATEEPESSRDSRHERNATVPSAAKEV